jgi:hypothetical protein
MGEGARQAVLLQKEFVFGYLGAEPKAVEITLAEGLCYFRG